MSSASERFAVLAETLWNEVSNTYPNTIAPVVESIELLYRDGMYWCKKDIGQKMHIAPAAKKEGNPTTINFKPSNLHTPGFWITAINPGTASKRPIKIGNNITNIMSIGLNSFLKVIWNALDHTMKYPTNTTYKK
jgi:hypothetical protein